MFCRSQNLHISQTWQGLNLRLNMFCRSQNLHISQTYIMGESGAGKFCRSQNLHISQTSLALSCIPFSFVEVKIYISLNHSM